jgi:hypothetical protein
MFIAEYTQRSVEAPEERNVLGFENKCRSFGAKEAFWAR